MQNFEGEDLTVPLLQKMAEDAAECEGALAELGVEPEKVRQAMVGELLAMPPPC